MLVEKDIRKLFQKLLVDHQVNIHVDGTEVNVRIFDHGSKLFLSAPVYVGSNYIPKSVRQSLSHKAPFADNHGIKTYLTINEKEYQVLLNFLGTLEQMNNESFRILLEDFGWLVDEWRLYLDENDKQDLIHIYVK